MTNTTDHRSDAVHELHMESKHWLSVIELWKFEVNFFELLLEKASPKTEEDNRKWQEFKLNTRNYANLFPRLESELNHHEGQLKNYLSGQNEFDPYEYRDTHATMRKQIQSLFQEIKEMKSALFSWMESRI